MESRQSKRKKRSKRNKNPKLTDAIVYHEGSKEVECVCGKIVRGEHRCNVFTCLRFRSCGWSEENKDVFQTCLTNYKIKLFDENWTIDHDEYNVCAKCWMKCEPVIEYVD